VKILADRFTLATRHFSSVIENVTIISITHQLQQRYPLGNNLYIL
jgi:hypothetical protein